MVTIIWIMYLAAKCHQKHYHFASKLYLDGKSYKISQKPTLWNFRFNRANRTILVLKNSMFLNKNGQKRLYWLNGNLAQPAAVRQFKKIRPVNTYTLRGLWNNTQSISKRAGRISEYM